MSTGFVSGGTTEEPAQRNELWVKAEEELENARRRNAEPKNHDGKSLYEVLQANKAAKQEAFEESIKLKNQFRSLDEDDVDFLNSIRDADEVKQQATQAEVVQKLDAFRKQQQAQQEHYPDASTLDITSLDKSNSFKLHATDWCGPRKRKRQGDGKDPLGLRVTKMQVMSVGAGKEALAIDHTDPKDSIGLESPKEPNCSRDSPSSLKRAFTACIDDTENCVADTDRNSNSARPVLHRTVNGLGLAAYSSDDE